MFMVNLVHNHVLITFFPCVLISSAKMSNSEFSLLFNSLYCLSVSSTLFLCLCSLSLSLSHSILICSFSLSASLFLYLSLSLPPSSSLCLSVSLSPVWLPASLRRSQSSSGPKSPLKSPVKRRSGLFPRLHTSVDGQTERLSRRSAHKAKQPGLQ